MSQAAYVLSRTANASPHHLIIAVFYCFERKEVDWSNLFLMVLVP
jgi:hypothetical protein